MGIELGGDRAGEEWGRAERRGGGVGGGRRCGERGGRVSFLVIKSFTSILKYQFIPMGNILEFHILTNLPSCESKSLGSPESINQHLSKGFPPFSFLALSFLSISLSFLSLSDTSFSFPYFLSSPFSFFNYYTVMSHSFFPSRLDFAMLCCMETAK